MLYLNHCPYYDEADGSGTGDLKVELTGDEHKDDLAIIGTEEETPEETPEEIEEVIEETPEGEETLEETPDGEEEVKEEKEEKEPLTKFNYSAVKTKYPDLFKDFPQLKTAFFREQEFSKVFPTIESAQEAATAQASFEGLRDLVLSGDATTFLNQVGEADKDALGSLAKNFLPGLRSIDKELYKEITAPIIQNLLHAVLQKGIAEKDLNVQNAAKLAYYKIFGTYEVEGAEEKSTEDTPEIKKFKTERQEFYAGKYRELSGAISNEIATELTNSIEAGLDPNKVLSPGIKKLVIKEIMGEIYATLGKDENHKGRMVNLWKREERNGFSGSLKDSIKTTFLSRAKAIMPAIRQKIRAEALKTKKTADTETKEKLEKGKRLNPGGKVLAGKSNIITPKEAKEKRMSDMDIITAGVK